MASIAKMDVFVVKAAKLARKSQPLRKGRRRARERAYMWVRGRWE
jgi:hypothetical protein